MNPPFPWYGGKAKIAGLVWEALGDPALYVEPFFGAGAVLLGRPAIGNVEVINDLDGYVVNFWRAVKSAPEQLAVEVEYPLVELDLHARHRWLVENPPLVSRLEEDADWFDLKTAAWWVWGISNWIGDGWCSGSLSKKRPSMNRPGRGLLSKAMRDGGRESYLMALADRLAHVHVLCGDWSRAVGQGIVGYPSGSGVGVFLDPPYSWERRKPDLYRVDSRDVAPAVLEWCLAQSESSIRVVLAALEGEYPELIEAGWRRIDWRQDRQRTQPESVYLSPACRG